MVDFVTSERSIDLIKPALQKALVGQFCRLVAGRFAGVFNDTPSETQ